MRSVKNVLPSVNVQMGSHTIGQPLPTNTIHQFDPFLLLHHFGPYKLGPDKAPFHVGAHPHRGFEPVTFVYKGEVEHKDSLGNHETVEAGGVQWLTAARGIVHSEGATEQSIINEEEVEIIQLWINLPANKKMSNPNYQPFKKEDIPVYTVEDNLGEVQIISGEFQGYKGPVNSLTGITALNVQLNTGGKLVLEMPSEEQLLIYQLSGKTSMNGIEVLAKELVAFKMDGTKVQLEADEDSRYLVLSGLPIEEEVVSWGPYVMNSQTEVLEALRDFQMGKMGMLTH